MKQLTLKESQSIQLELMREIHRVCEDNDITYYLIAGSCLGAVRHGGFIPWDDDIDIGMFRKDYERFCSIFNEKMSTDKYFLQNFKTDPNVHFALSRICIKGTFYSNERTNDKDICHNAYIDLFPLDNVPNGAMQRKVQNVVLKLLKYMVCSKSLKFTKKSSMLFFGVLKGMLCFVPLRNLQVLRDKTMKFYQGKKVGCVCSFASKYAFKKQTMPIEFYGNPIKRKFEDYTFNVPAQTEAYLTHLYGDNYMKLPPVEKRVLPHPIYLI